LPYEDILACPLKSLSPPSPLPGSPLREDTLMSRQALTVQAYQSLNLHFSNKI